MRIKSDRLVGVPLIAIKVQQPHHRMDYRYEIADGPDQVVKAVS